MDENRIIELTEKVLTSKSHEEHKENLNEAFTEILKSDNVENNTYLFIEKYAFNFNTPEYKERLKELYKEHMNRELEFDDISFNNENAQKKYSETLYKIMEIPARITHVLSHIYENVNKNIYGNNKETGDIFSKGIHGLHLIEEINEKRLNNNEIDKLITEVLLSKNLEEHDINLKNVFNKILDSKYKLIKDSITFFAEKYSIGIDLKSYNKLLNEYAPKFNPNRLDFENGNTTEEYGETYNRLKKIPIEVKVKLLKLFSDINDTKQYINKKEYLHHFTEEINGSSLVEKYSTNNKKSIKP